MSRFQIKIGSEFYLPSCLSGKNFKVRTGPRKGSPALDLSSARDIMRILKAGKIKCELVGVEASDNTSTAHATAFAQSISPFVDKLAARWQDERDYEDLDEYRIAIQKNAPSYVKVTAMISRPFGFHFKIGTKFFRIVTTKTRIKLQML